MSEENQVVETVVEAVVPVNSLDQLEQEFKQAREEANKPAVVPEVVVELTEAEQQAAQQGWKPKDQWDASKGRWRPAEEYIDRGELFEKIESQKQELAHLKQTFKGLGDHIKNTEDAAYKRALVDLDSQRQQAIRDQNPAAFKEAETKMLEAYNQRQEVEKLAAPAPVAVEPSIAQSPDVIDFMSRNKHWFNTNTPEGDKMCRAAQLAEEQLVLANPNINEKDLLIGVEKEIQRHFPHRFDNPKRTEPSTVVTKSPTAPKTDYVNSLSNQQRKFGEDLVKYKVYASLAEYANDLNKSGAIK